MVERSPQPYSQLLLITVILSRRFATTSIAYGHRVRSDDDDERVWAGVRGCGRAGGDTGRSGSGGESESESGASRSRSRDVAGARTTPRVLTRRRV
ncbi:hypothetical protein SCP_0601200 [Sparassis crispa]|uniref:Uncharacterized protein n=1 Tax=Sparassis crispa TaxID=139825 RepID=A0A401GPL7_9APHY|nr:hypothetical protein SCP_0601200 [Sparassis crispa]GBE84142.1 hypothetical protein SCP_0601200 [Sparassis crispa]